ncbi:hypothetical protein BGX34_011779 [Mortierella sp. NVP85]|nr:hypothetical protein BGX34_011779 [Mortierella sp. NVP85]
MVFGSIIPQGNLSLPQTLSLAKIYLDTARNLTTDTEIFLALCRDAEASLTQAKKFSKNTKEPSVQGSIAAIHIDLSNLLEANGYKNEAKIFQKRSEKWGQRHRNETNIDKINWRHQHHTIIKTHAASSLKGSNL